jgi:hypothetical protein
METHNHQAMAHNKLLSGLCRDYTEGVVMTLQNGLLPPLEALLEDFVTLNKGC